MVGRPSESTHRAYLYWKLAQARKGRITLGPIEKKPARAEGSMQVLPLGMGRPVVGRLDEAVKALGYKSRMAFIRDALVSRLRQHDSDVTRRAADAIEAEGF